MADTLLRDKNGKEELWYSEDYFNKCVDKSNEYVREQIERAFNAGLNRGMRVEFHGMYDTNKQFDETYLNEHIKRFYDKLDEQYKEAFENDEVWIMGSHRKQRPYEQ
jgi:hypothetical protein